MRNLFKGEAYRLFHKRNMYLYLGAVFIGYLLIAFMRSGGFTASSVVDDAGNLFQLMPALLGGYFFTSLYSDDLTSKNLITLVGYGTSRTRIVLTKLALMALFTAASFAVLVGLHLGIYALLGAAATGPAIHAVLAFAVQAALATLGFAAVASVVVYGLQRPTFAVVTYFMLAFSVVAMLINAATSMLNIDLSGHLISGTTSQIMAGLVVPGAAGSIMAPGLELLGYLALATAAALYLFKNREMEF